MWEFGAGFTWRGSIGRNLRRFVVFVWIWWHSWLSTGCVSERERYLMIFDNNLVPPQQQEGVARNLETLGMGEDWSRAPLA